MPAYPDPESRTESDAASHASGRAFWRKTR
jgi:hypothetical protein